MTKVLHSGDLGDILLFLPTARAIGNVELWIDDRPYTAKILGPRYEVILPLLEAQPYIASVHAGTPTGDFLDASTFRTGGHPFGDRLTDLQARWLKVPISHEPWITASPNRAFAGRVIVHRSPRYQNPFFPWRTVGAHFGDNLLAVGSPQEVKDLETTCGRKLEYLPTANFVELAEAMAGADLFIGNQSSPCALAVGLGIKYVQETCLWTPDCLFPERADAVHCVDGEIPGVAEPWQPEAEVDENVTPPGGWKWTKEEIRGVHSILSYAVRESRMTKQEIIAQNVARLPGYFFRQDRDSLFGSVQKKLLELSQKAA